MTQSPFDKLCDAVSSQPARIAIVLGSGMSVVAEQVMPSASVPFAEIPGLCRTTIAGHRGRLTLGVWAGQRVLLFEGRLHYYEGHSWDAVVAPVRIAAELGAKVLLLTNAAGGIHDALVPGSFMAISDHIEWTPHAAGDSRTARHHTRQGDLRILRNAVDELRIPLHAGIYAAVTGPSYETPSEIQALKRWGADAVGMSTAQEIFWVRVRYGMSAISCITNRAAGLSAAPLNHDDVLYTAAQQSKLLAELLGKAIKLTDALNSD